MDNECYSVSSSPAEPTPKPLKAKSKNKSPVKGLPKNSEANAQAAGLTDRSVFHEPWWLDATTDGNWGLAEVRHGDEVVGEMPYMLERKGIWRISTQPPLTRTLGPVIKPPRSGSGGERDWCYRMEIANELVARLPACAHFHQIMDTRMSQAEAIAFSLHGFEVSIGYTLELSHEHTEAQAWSSLRRNTRNWVRRATELLTIREIADPDVFVDFYDANLAVRKRNNVYGSIIMRRLLGEVITRGAGVLLGAFDEQGRLQAETALVWDSRAVYYLLSSRQHDAHGGAISLLIWEGARIARERRLIFDFDGISTASILDFLSGFGGRLVTRYEIERMRADYGALRTVLRGERMAMQTSARRLRKARLEKT
jgi:hypothetical protein